MSKKSIAVDLIKKKLNNDSYMTYKEIADITNYHPKYILYLRKEVEDGSVRLIHGNRNKKSSRAISQEEIIKIIKLYKKSHVSVRKFYKFYNRRSYSCIYNILKKNGLLEKNR